MKVLLQDLLPRFFPSLDFLCISHEGKSDLEKSLGRKLKGWTVPGDSFVVIRDNDGNDTTSLKAALSAICAQAGYSDVLIHIACQELEAWYFGDPKAMSVAFADPNLMKIAKSSKYRKPDNIIKPSHTIKKLCPNFQKVSGARAMAAQISYSSNTSPSFRGFIEAIANVSSAPLPT